MCKFLHNYRGSVHSSTRKAPADLMIRPNGNFRGTVEQIPQDKRKKTLHTECKFEMGDYKVYDAVFVKNYD